MSPTRSAETLAASTRAPDAGLVAGYAARAGQLPLATIIHTGPPRPVDGAGLAIAAPLPVLSGTPLEMWSTPDEPRRGRTGAVDYAATESFLFGVLRTPADSPGALESAALEMYSALLAASERQGYPQILRTWNCVPGINRDEGPLERYKLFCRGRAHAFQRHYGERFAERLPAASAVGTAEPELVVWFLAGRDAPRRFENPRQISAWSYPPQYGPRSPSFTRATSVRSGSGALLLISGTASIVGHSSTNAGNATSQVDETIDNMAELIAHAGAAGPRPLDALEMLKVFVRHPDQLDEIEAAVRRRTGSRVPLLFVRADICRAELLVEIEGTARF